METLRHITTFIVLSLVQVLVLNHVRLLGCATPLLYVYFILLFPLGTPRGVVVACAFAMGLAMDVFTNTPGVAAAPATLLGLLQPYMLEAFAPKDSAADLEPHIKSLGAKKYAWYVSAGTLTHCLLLFTIEAFGFFNWMEWLMQVAGSSVLTASLILVIENIRRR